MSNPQSKIDVEVSEERSSLPCDWFERSRHFITRRHAQRSKIFHLGHGKRSFELCIRPRLSQKPPTNRRTEFRFRLNPPRRKRKRKTDTHTRDKKKLGPPTVKDLTVIWAGEKGNFRGFRPGHYFETPSSNRGWWESRGGLHLSSKAAISTV